MHIRVLALDPVLQAAAGGGDGRGAGRARASRSSADVTLDECGMASLDLPLSTEPNLGVWKAAGKRRRPSGAA